MSIKIKINDKAVKGLFKQLKKNADFLRPALVKIGGVLETASDQAFQRQGAPGKKWEKLKPETVKQRGAAGPILNRTGGRGLIGSVTTQINVNSVSIGSNLPYARAHQLGSDKQGIPARPYLIVGRKEVSISLKILGNHLVKGT